MNSVNNSFYSDCQSKCIIYPNPLGTFGGKTRRRKTEMTYGNIDREQMLRLAGIEYDFNEAYTPATIGKKNLVTRPKNIWGDQFCNLNFTNIDELRAIRPETVTARQCFYQKPDGDFAEVKDKFAIVGDESENTYAIHSGKYEPIQHHVIVDAMADACNDTSLSVFGHFDEDKGRFNGYGTFANPDIHINLGVSNGFEDPVMLGMRFFNSHNGDSKFGGEIFGIRAVCGNYMAWGETLGKVKIMHFKSEENVADELSKILMGFVDQIDALKDRVHYIRDTPVTVDEQEAILWGIGMYPGYIENILTHKVALNPEMATASKGSVWDIYNASTAFITYHVGGNHTVNMNLTLSEKIEQMLVQDSQKLISQGEKNKERYLEQIRQRELRQKVRVVA